MAEAEIRNETPFVAEVLYLVDEEVRPLLVAVIKATFTIGRRGACELAPQQVELRPGGECWGDDPEVSSYKYEPEVAFFKPATDVVLIGYAHAPAPRTTRMLVEIAVGRLRKRAHVFGDRVWFRSLGSAAISNPLPFESVPLVYERAFGGWDRTAPDPARHACEPRNPVGAGFRLSFEEGLRLPNLEEPTREISGFGDRPPPAGFGFTSPHWQPRARLAGTYDAAWREARSPLLPLDFDRRHLNAASEGLIYPGYLRGDEAVRALGVTRGGPLAFTLPGVPPPAVRVALRNGKDARLETQLDTLIVEPDLERVLLLWRGHARLPSGPHDVRAVEVASSARAR